MQIGVIAYEMEGARTGVGRYLEGLLQGIAHGGHGGEWLLFFKGDPFPHPLWDDPPAGCEATFRPFFDGRPSARPILWEQLRLPRLLRRQRFDALFSPSYSLPARLCAPALVTVHDLSFEHLPEEFSSKERLRRRFLARRSVRRAARVLADTHEIAHELERCYGVSAAKLGIVPLGIDAAFRAAAEGNTADEMAALAEHGVQPPYLLALGTVLRRRRVDLAIEAFAHLAAAHPQLRLVIAGNNRLRRPQNLDTWIAASGVEERIVRLGYVEERLLPALYQGAVASFYLSSYEGFGLPPLESLAAGTPAIVGRGLALDELWPNYPGCCRLLDVATIAGITDSLLTEPTLRQEIATAATSRLAMLTWERAARRLRIEIERVL